MDKNYTFFKSSWFHNNDLSLANQIASRFGTQLLDRTLSKVMENGNCQLLRA
jgi:hypothetical protein